MSSDETLHPSHHYSSGHRSLWNVSDFCLRVVSTLETRSYLHQLASPTLPLSTLLPPSLSSSSIFPFSKIPLEACSIYTASLPIWHALFFLTYDSTIGGHVRDSLEFPDCFPAVCCLPYALCQSPNQGVNIPMNVTLFQLMLGYTMLDSKHQSSTRNSN